jgi:hypothetical protein
LDRSGGFAGSAPFVAGMVSRTTDLFRVYDHVGAHTEVQATVSYKGLPRGTTRRSE